MDPKCCLDIKCPLCGCHINVEFSTVLDLTVADSQHLGDISNWQKSCDLRRLVKDACDNLSRELLDLKAEIKDVRVCMVNCGSRICSRRYLGLQDDFEQLFHALLKKEAQIELTKYQFKVQQLLLECNDFSRYSNSET